jgi:SAM-dependent methyltransferase
MKPTFFFLVFLLGFSSAYAQEGNVHKYGDCQVQWNKILKQDWFDHNPNKLLAETIIELEPGSALDVAMGEGRNSIFLAARGWQVTGFDIANEALDSIRKRADHLNLQIETVHASDQDFDYGRNKWDLVVLCYIDIICDGCIANAAYVSKLSRSLKKGGIVVYEFYHRDYFLENWEDPGTWGCTEGQLTSQFESYGLTINKCDTFVDTNDWSDEPCKVIQLVAEKQ